MKCMVYCAVSSVKCVQCVLCSAPHLVDQRLDFPEVPGNSVPDGLVALVQPARQLRGTDSSCGSVDYPN